MNVTSGSSHIAITAMANGSLITSTKLMTLVNHVKGECMALLGHGGPTLTTAAFSTSIHDLQTTL